MIIGMTYDKREDYELINGQPFDLFFEFDQIETINYLVDILKRLGHDVIEIGNINQLVKFLNKEKEIDLIFNIAEGLEGRSREAQVPALLEAYGIPYTFSDPYTMILCMEKSKIKQLLRFSNIPTPDFFVINNMNSLGGKIIENLTFPVIIKPLFGGCSMGISNDSITYDFSSTINQIRTTYNLYQQPVLVEDFLPGREFTVGILENPNGSNFVGCTEIKLQGKERHVYGAIEKEHCEQLVIYQKPSRLEKDLLSRIKEISKRAYEIAECKDAARIDIRLDKNNEPEILEINPLPGLHPWHSDLPIIGTQNGISYKEIINMILSSAIKRWKL